MGERECGGAPSELTAGFGGKSDASNHAAPPRSGLLALRAAVASATPSGISIEQLSDGELFPFSDWELPQLLDDHHLLGNHANGAP